MRVLPCFLSLALLAGCAGYATDYWRPRSEILGEQLARYGLGEEQARCLSAQLEANLSVWQLRQLALVAERVTRGYFEPERLTMRDLRHVAMHVQDPKVPLELARADEHCQLAEEARLARLRPPAQPAPPPAPRGPSWVNLGAAPSGQTIGIDAASLEQQGSLRTAWFRLTDPGRQEPNPTSFRLRVDCAARTISPLAHRDHDSAGAVTASEEYPAAEVRPLPVEGGTVMEIAWLAMCT